MNIDHQSVAISPDALLCGARVDCPFDPHPARRTGADSSRRTRLATPLLFPDGVRTNRAAAYPT